MSEAATAGSSRSSGRVRERPAEWGPRLYEQDLAQTLHDMGAGRIPLPKSDARHHHFVPKFWLRRFAPPGRPKQVFRIDRQRGAPKLVPIRTAAQQERLYGVKGDDGTYDNRVEGFLAIIENEAAPGFEAIGARRNVSASQSFAFEMLLGMQLMRSPRTLELVGQLVEAQGRAGFHAAAHDPALLRRELERVHGRALSGEKVKEVQQAMRAVLDAGGGIRLADNRLAGLAAIAENFLESGLYIAQADKRFLASPSKPFVLNDVGFAVHDGCLIFPLQPDLCMVALAPADPENPAVHIGSCEPESVDIINLRLYAWADQSIYGATQESLAALRSLARRHPHRARRPSPGEHPYIAAIARGDLIPRGERR